MRIYCPVSSRQVLTVRLKRKELCSEGRELYGPVMTSRVTGGSVVLSPYSSSHVWDEEISRLTLQILNQYTGVN